jgi:hypothetical protein
MINRTLTKVDIKPAWQPQAINKKPFWQPQNKGGNYV